MIITHLTIYEKNMLLPLLLFTLSVLVQNITTYINVYIIILFIISVLSVFFHQKHASQN